MLVLSRKRDEVIRIGNDIKIKVLKIGPNRIRLGIEAPDGVYITREQAIPHMDGLSGKDALDLKRKRQNDTRNY